MCRTIDEFVDAAVENSAWSDRTFGIKNVLKTTDGALVVHVTISGTLNGTWCHLTGHGQHVSFDACVIFRFDEDGKIVLASASGGSRPSAPALPIGVRASLPNRASSGGGRAGSTHP